MKHYCHKYSLFNLRAFFAPPMFASAADVFVGNARNPDRRLHERSDERTPQKAYRKVSCDRFTSVAEWRISIVQVHFSARNTLHCVLIYSFVSLFFFNEDHIFCVIDPLHSTNSWGPVSYSDLDQSWNFCIAYEKLYRGRDC